MQELVRIEFGYTRTTCDCNVCVTNCRFMPGFLIPSDLDRLMPSANPLEWAESNLLASPGALVQRGAERFRIQTLVPRTKQDGSCIHLDSTGHCGIHSVAPFGCAFFDCKSDRYDLSAKGLIEIMRAWQHTSLYAVIWTYLHSKGLVQHSPDLLRARMAEHDRA